MKARNPAAEPREGDVLKYGDRTVTVTRREGQTIYYRVSQGKGPAGPEKNQELALWSAWAVQAKVKARGLADGECLFSINIAGPCGGCGRYCGSGMHLGSEKPLCGKCCKACSKVAA